MKTIVISMTCFMILAFAVHAKADRMDFGLGFTAAEQSLWGGGPSGGFSASGGTPGPIGVWWDIGASSGTVSGQFNGNFSVDHAASLAAPGYTSLSMSYAGDTGGGYLKSDLGAWASLGINVFVDMPWPIPNINWHPTVFSEDYGLNINENFTPKIGAEVSGQDSFSAYDLSVGAFGVGAGLSFDVLQTDHFMPRGISGLMKYELDGGTDFGLAEFMIGESGEVNVDAYLDQGGTWNFSFLDLSLDNEFYAMFGLGLTPYIDYLIGEWSPGTLAFDLFGSKHIELAFNDADFINAFSIVVDDGEPDDNPVPEPATMILVGLGLAGIGMGRKRNVIG